MSTVYVTSDWHFGHKGIAHKFRSKYRTDQEHDDDLLYTTLGIVTKRDLLICVGDMAFTREGLGKLAILPCKKILVRGNHDYLTAAEYLTVFDDVHGAFKYKGHFITHIPIHESELYRGGNIHGHCHNGGPFESGKGQYMKYYNCVPEFNNYQIIPMSKVLNRLNGAFKDDNGS